jgi:hypothetical protein
MATRKKPKKPTPKAMVKAMATREAKIEKAFKEMLALFVPDKEIRKAFDMLDDNERTGVRHWPPVKNPSMNDVRRWLSILEDK